MFKDPITGKVLPKQNYLEKAGKYVYLSGVYPSVAQSGAARGPRRIRDRLLWAKVLIAPAVGMLSGIAVAASVWLTATETETHLAAVDTALPKRQPAPNCSTRWTGPRPWPCALWSGSRRAYRRRRP